MSRETTRLPPTDRTPAWGDREKDDAVWRGDGRQHGYSGHGPSVNQCDHRPADRFRQRGQSRAGGKWLVFATAKAAGSLVTVSNLARLAPAPRLADPTPCEMKIGAKVVRHAKYVTFQLAEVAMPRKLFRAILRRIAKLRLPETRGSPA